MAAPPQRKLDIFEALHAIDTRRMDWLAAKPEDAQKEFAPPVVLRWASAIEGGGPAAEYYLRAVNERANLHSKEIMTQHPDLLFRLLASCGTGQRQRHQWLAGSAKAKSAGKPRDLIARLHPMASEAEVDLLLSRYTPESFIELVRGAGLTPAEEKEVLRAYGTKDPDSKPRKTKGKAKGGG